MKLLLTTSSIFSCAFVIHWLVWRMGVPKNSSRTLLMIFFSILPIGLSLTKLNGPETLQVALLYISATLFYILAYSTVEAESPTLALLERIKIAGKVGVPEEELRHYMSAKSFVRLRLTALLRAGLVVFENGVFKCKPGGPGIGFFLINKYRELMGNKGAGG